MQVLSGRFPSRVSEPSAPFDFSRGPAVPSPVEGRGPGTRHAQRLGNVPVACGRGGRARGAGYGLSDGSACTVAANWPLTGTTLGSLNGQSASHVCGTHGFLHHPNAWQRPEVSRPCQCDTAGYRCRPACSTSLRPAGRLCGPGSRGGRPLQQAGEQLRVCGVAGRVHDLAEPGEERERVDVGLEPVAVADVWCPWGILRCRERSLYGPHVCGAHSRTPATRMVTGSRASSLGR